MPLSVGLVEGLVKCEEASAKCGGWIEASAKYVGWATKVCCGAAKCGDGAAGVTNGCRKGWKLAGSG